MYYIINRNLEICVLSIVNVISSHAYSEVHPQNCNLFCLSVEYVELYIEYSPFDAVNVHAHILLIKIHIQTSNTVLFDLFVMCVFLFWTLKCERGMRSRPQQKQNTIRNLFTWNMDDTTRHFSDFTTHLSTPNGWEEFLSPFHPLFLSL